MGQVVWNLLGWFGSCYYQGSLGRMETRGGREGKEGGEGRVPVEGCEEREEVVRRGRNRTGKAGGEGEKKRGLGRGIFLT